MLIAKGGLMLIHPHLPKGFTCVGCALSTWKSVCDSCKQALHWNHEFLPSPVSELEALAPLLFSYSRTQSLIRRFKEYGGTDLKRALFRMPHPLKHKLLETHFFGVVAIPQDADRSYVRGHEPAKAVAGFFAKQLGLPSLPLLGLKNKKTKRLTGLSRFERDCAENPFTLLEARMHRPFHVLLQEKLYQGKEVRILLVDDLITSGSTLSKASASLRELHPGLKIWGAGIGFRPHRLVH